jgi:hypothetical protein
MICRTLARLDAEALAAAIGAWFHAAITIATTMISGGGGGDGGRGRRQDLRGARRATDDRQVYVLAAMDHATRAVLAQQRGRLPSPDRHGPSVMACLRNLAIGLPSSAGPINLAALRHHARDPARPLATLGSPSNEPDIYERTPGPWGSG